MIIDYSICRHFPEVDQYYIKYIFKEGTSTTAHDLVWPGCVFIHQVQDYYRRAGELVLGGQYFHFRNLQKVIFAIQPSMIQKCKQN